MRSVFLSFFLLCALSLSAQSSSAKPQWIDELPSAEDKNFYYRVTYAEAEDVNTAYSHAFAMAILEGSWRIGVDAKTESDLQALQGYVADNIAVAKQNTRLKLNKVCSWYNEATAQSSGKVKLYVLWQVARYVNKDPEFEDFTQCGK